MGDNLNDELYQYHLKHLYKLAIMARFWVFICILSLIVCNLALPVDIQSQVPAPYPPFFLR